MPRALKLFLHRLQLLILQLTISVMSGRKPILLAGPGSAQRLCATVVELGARRVLIVTDAVLVKIGLIAPLAQALEAAGAACAVYDGVEPDPTHAQIEAGV
ncbi:MAG TPA: iron-containing alcohol dehydrogenase, partial [Pseudomonadales bacterium]|nr:iron-containing alcohol dehydrogenase [Pseudomonadales bacterium]